MPTNKRHSVAIMSNEQQSNSSELPYRILYQRPKQLSPNCTETVDDQLDATLKQSDNFHSLWHTSNYQDTAENEGASSEESSELLVSEAQEIIGGIS